MFYKTITCYREMPIGYQLVPCIYPIAIIHLLNYVIGDHVGSYSNGVGE